MSEFEFEHITTKGAVETYQSSTPIFKGILQEVRGLSKKKPEATMSASKVKIVNRVLADLLTILKDEPAGKYLDVLDDEALPQMSDAVLTMVQFETALSAFYSRYHQYISVTRKSYWITEELLAEWDKEAEEVWEEEGEPASDKNEDDV
ncbi:hypothetical protein RZS28_14570 [Methylocapsa polymorpha]|uniref:Uncharacterized protein n=1 Tax=Methylocapsa polymorpha TaxID=3080828 RepID=A0ABZ0HR34_9HYPH|nr:hypothetical protein RZS28_14570 [Methylocapsa sp. RX1]